MNKIVIINNKTCKLELDDEKILNKIKYELSFIQEGYQYSVMHKEHSWDGRVFLIKNKNNSFNYPLLKRVKTLLDTHKVIYDIEDNRKPFIKSNPLDISKRLKEIGMIPRDYQQDVCNLISQNDNGICRLATASGKTMLSALAAANENKHTLILTIGIDILYQFHSLYEKIFKDNKEVGKIGICGDGQVIIGDKFTIATTFTIGRALKLSKKDMKSEDNDVEDEKFDETNSEKILELIGKTQMLILDECHCGSTATMKAIYKALPNNGIEKIIGLSGTPFRNGTEDLEIINYLGEKIADISSSFLIEKNVLPQPIIKFINVPSFSMFSKTYHEIYREKIVDNNLRNNMILNNTKELVSKGYKTLVLFKTIDHGKNLLKLFKENGVRCSLLSGKDKFDKRKKVKEDLELNKIDVLILSTIGDIGLDIPCLAGMVLAGSGKSFVRCLQRCGRILRPFPGKKIVAIVDFYDDVRYLKGHAKKRLETYQSEPGFKLILPKNLK